MSGLDFLPPTQTTGFYSEWAINIFALTLFMFLGKQTSSGPELIVTPDKISLPSFPSVHIWFQLALLSSCGVPHHHPDLPCRDGCQWEVVSNGRLCRLHGVQENILGSWSPWLPCSVLKPWIQADQVEVLAVLLTTCFLMWKMRNTADLQGTIGKEHGSCCMIPVIVKLMMSLCVHPLVASFPGPSLIAQAIRTNPPLD